MAGDKNTHQTWGHLEHLGQHLGHLGQHIRQLGQQLGLLGQNGEKFPPKCVLMKFTLIQAM